MEASAWLARWQEGRIGFHEGRPNVYLDRYADRLATCPRVLVPLCGKAEDLAYLASRGHQVVGVELVEDAVRAFFVEHGLTPLVTDHGDLVEYTSGAITVFAGDVFAATRERLGTIDAIYDRAALIALPPELRRRYVAHLRTLVPAGTRLLVVTIEYDQDRMSGPPFAVLEAEVRELYAGASIELLDERPDPRVREGAPPMVERCFAITM